MFLCSYINLSGSLTALPGEPTIERIRKVDLYMLIWGPWLPAHTMADWLIKAVPGLHYVHDWGEAHLCMIVLEGGNIRADPPCSCEEHPLTWIFGSVRAPGTSP